MIEPVTFIIIVGCGAVARLLKPRQPAPLQQWAYVGKLFCWGVLFSLLVPANIPTPAVFGAVAGMAGIDLAGDWLAHWAQRQQVKNEPTSRLAYQRVRREIG